MSYLIIGAIAVQVLFIVVGIHISYKMNRGEKVNAIEMAGFEAYQKIRKLDLLGEITKENRLSQGLKLAEDILYNDKKIDTTTAIKKTLAKQFEILHLKDKNQILSANSVAVEPEKKPKG